MWPYHGYWFAAMWGPQWLESRTIYERPMEADATDELLGRAFLLTRLNQKLYTAKLPSMQRLSPEMVISSFIRRPPAFAEWIG